MKKTLLMFGLLTGTFVALSQNTKPNIIIILADDMGYSDLGCYGNNIIETPNLDKLAENGVRFSQFYNTARCSPTRASLLTGLYPHQAGVGYLESLDKGEGHPGYRGRLNNQCVTIAEVLKNAGYFTAISGKWHVGGSYGVYAWDRGFDRSLTSDHSAFYYSEDKNAQGLCLNGTPIDPLSDRLPANWYSSDLYAEFGLKFVDEARAEGKPFFLYLAFNAPHFPLQAPQETIAKYKGKFNDGWDRMRQPVYEKQVEMGLIDKKWPLAPKHPDVPDWDQLKPEIKERMAHIQEIYAACVDRLDVAVGTLVEGLKERGELDNTLIVFLSDNGANAEQGPYGKYSGKEKSGTVNSSVFQGQSWATYSNTPFRRYKHFTTEGGISAPCIFYWPGGIAKKQKGAISQQYGHVIDLMPTFVEVSGANYPETYMGNDILSMQGASLLPVFKGESILREGAVYWEHEGNRGGRLGKWKIVAFNHEPWQMYDMENDRTEQNDVSLEHPEIFQQMTSGWEIWAKQCHVEPWPDLRNSAGQPEAVEKNYQIQYER